ncbi:hypothetical protein CEXT_711241 [Caerostris extrusa]|uniref:Uncharacterized protein n=1 Tax=Caerostris extrusa TaxID=172846 RepID=A0AAV4PQ59_CAEEX|nr:hypothetical protein CEXT_711241 [Caerostris extrusa]
MHCVINREREKHHGDGIVNAELGSGFIYHDLVVKRKTMRKRRGEKNNNRKTHFLGHEKQFRHQKVDQSSEQRGTE